MSKISVTTIAGLTSGGDANKVKIESGDDFNVVSGKVGIGTVNAPSNKNTVTPSLNVSGSGVNGAAQITRHTSVGGGGALLHLSGTRGSDVNSYTILQNNDGIGTLSFQAADGNEFVQGAAIQANVDGTPGDNDMPARLSFRVTQDGQSTSTERMRIHNGGVVSFSNGIELGSGLDATAANTLDDYEEGTWTPTAGSGAGTLTSTTAVYTKIGRVVYVSAYVTFTGASTSGNRTYGGLPFPVLDYIGATSVDFQGTAWSNNSAGYLYFEGGSSNFQNNLQKNFQGSFTASDNSRFQGFYFTT